MTIHPARAIVLIEMPSHYVLTVKGEPGELLRAAFDDVQVSTAPGVTELSAELDQPALHGLLTRIEDLGLELLEMRLVVCPEMTDADQIAALRERPGGET